jgi:hypothetical protein
MPQPASQDVHIDEVQTDIAISYMQSQDVYLATKVFPVVTVDKQSNKYIVWDRNDWFRDDAEKRADATESVGSGYRFSQDSYYADVYAIHKDVGSQARANADRWINLEQGAIRFVARKILLRQEIQWFTDFFTTGVWATDYNVPLQWSDVNSDPIEDFESNIETMVTTTGFPPNTAVFGYRAFRRLKNHPDILARLSYNGGTAIPAQVTPAMIASILGIDRIFVSRALKATNVEGETAAYAMAAGNHVWMGYVTGAPSVEEPSAGYIFAWDYAGYSASVGVDSFEIRKIKAVRFEAEAAWDGKVTAPDLGVFMPNVVP